MWELSIQAPLIGMCNTTRYRESLCMKLSIEQCLDKILQNQTTNKPDLEDLGPLSLRVLSPRFGVKYGRR